MFKQKEEIIVIAVLAIITSAILSSYGVYYFLNLRSSKVVKPTPQVTPPQVTPPQVTPTSNQAISPEATITPEISPKKHLETTNYNGESENQKIAKLVGDFYNHLESGNYNLAVPLLNWQHQGLEEGINKTEILQKICSQENVKIKIRILTIQKMSNGQDYNVVVNYLDKNNQVYVNSVRVAGQFINETDFVIGVIKIDNNFLVNTLPGMLITTAE